MSVLAEICDRKREHIIERKAAVSLADIKKRIADRDTPRGFRAALEKRATQNKPALITEIKKASPSGGLIRPDFDPASLARTLECAGAACLSVLTDGPYFQGRDEDFIAARTACTLPVLRKDFMIDEYQIYESRALGADCILIIMAALDDAQAKHLHDCAISLGMDALVETHDEEEVERAVNLGAKTIGVNNRNLKTLKTDLQTSQRLAKLIPADVTKVAESGIRSSADIAALTVANYHAFLIGESIMAQADIAVAVAGLLNAA